MRWEALFEDLAGQLDAAERAEDEALVAELTAAEAGRTAFADRLRGRQGAQVRLRLRNGDDVEGVVLDAAPHWVLVGDGERRTLAPLEAIQAAWPLAHVAPEAGRVERGLRITHVLRALAREGARVRLTCDGGSYAGWLTRVGADHVDLRPAAGEPGPLTVALGAVVSVSTV